MVSYASKPQHEVSPRDATNQTMNADNTDRELRLMEESMAERMERKFGGIGKTDGEEKSGEVRAESIAMPTRYGVTCGITKTSNEHNQ